jgi:S1-C subfamily serine protease
MLLAPCAALAEEPPYFHLHLARIHALRDRVVPAVVTVEARREEGGFGPPASRDGGGIHVGGGRVITAGFYLKGAVSLSARLPDGSRGRARLVRESEPLGLALLDVPAARAIPVPQVAPDDAGKAGDALYLLVNPATESGQLRLGWLLAANRREFYWRATFPARNGHPLWDEWGRVAALCGLPGPGGLSSLVIPAWAIRKFLDAK